MEAIAGNNGQTKTAIDPAELQRKRIRQGLLLSRSRVVHQLEVAQNPNHRRMLEQALADLDSRLTSS